MAPKTTDTAPCLTALPPELLIHILSHLDVQSLVAVQLLSKIFDALFKDPLNENVIWRNACVIHGLIGFAQSCEASTPSPPRESTQPQAVQDGNLGSEPPRREWGRWREWVERRELGGLKGEATDVVWSDVLDLYSSQSFVGLSTDVNWKAFFKRRLEIHRSFIGQLPSQIICYKDIDSCSAIDPDPNDKDSYIAKIRRIYEALIRIADERRKRPRPRPTIRTWAGVARGEFISDRVEVPEDTAAPSETALTDALLARFLRTLHRLLPTNEKVHRIKVDERNGFFLTTTRVGGLVVRDMESEKVLWELPKTYVRAYAHLEYESGYIIFDRLDGSKEVWRSSSINPLQPPSTLMLQPDDRQHLASALATPFLTPTINSDPETHIRRKIRSEAMSTSHLPTRKRLLDMANSNTFSATKRLPVEAIVRCALTLSEEMVPSNGGLSGLDFDMLETGWAGEATGTQNVWDEDPLGRGRDGMTGATSDGSGGKGSSRSTAQGGSGLHEDAAKGDRADELKKATDPKRLSPHFVPHLVVPVPQIQVSTQGQPVVMVEDPTRVYRFVYPYLLSASSHKAYVWDIRTGERVQVVDNIQRMNVPEGYGRGYDSDFFGSAGEGSERSVSCHGVAEIPPLAGPSSGGVRDEDVYDYALRDGEHAVLDVNVGLPPYSGPQPGGVGSSSVGASSQGKGKGNEKSTVEEEEGDDPMFATFNPFKTGWWDANSTFSDNEFGTSRPTTKSSQGGKRRRGDPLALLSNISTQLGNLNYVELGERWIFLCGEDGFRVFARGEEFFEGEGEGARSSGSTAVASASSTSPSNKNRSSDAINVSASTASTIVPRKAHHWTPEDFTTLSPGQLVLRIPSDKIQYSRWSASLGPQSYRPHWGSQVIRQEVLWGEETVGKSEVSVNVGVVDSPARSQMWQSDTGRGNRSRARRGGFGHGGNQRRHGNEEMEENGLGAMIKRRRRMHDEFVAVHVSPCQNHLALLLSSSRLLFVPHFERLIKAEEDLWDVGVDLQLGSVACPSVYLSYGGGEAQGGGSAGRVAVVTQQGIYIITPYLKDPFKNSASSSSTRPVELIVMRLAPSFLDPRRLVDVSCLQMSDTGVWVNYDVPEPSQIEAEVDGIGAKGNDKLEEGKGKKKGKKKKSKTTTSGNGGQSSNVMQSKSQHTFCKPRRWTSQQFPLGTTPPSQSQGEKCQWNDAKAILHDDQFTKTLNEKRIDEYGMGSRGVQDLPNGDILVATEDIARDGLTWIEQMRAKSEVHQIRFIPSEY